MSTRSGSSSLRKSAVIFLTIASAAFGQVATGTLQGFVTDASGAPIPAAEVKATEVQTNQSFSARTNDSGEYRIFALPVGTYTATGERQGFGPVSKSGVVLQVNGQPPSDRGGEK
jgi:uncharacterized protein YfaS (alpha-2-macroglobulin family)